MSKQPNIVIVGGGVAGMELATQLGHKLGRTQKAIITLIDKDSSHIWKPILHKIAQYTYDFIYRSHQKRLHGIIKGYLLWLSERINKIIRPQAKLDQ